IAVFIALVAAFYSAGSSARFIGPIAARARAETDEILRRLAIVAGRPAAAPSLAGGTLLSSARLGLLGRILANPVSREFVEELTEELFGDAYAQHKQQEMGTRNGWDWKATRATFLGTLTGTAVGIGMARPISKLVNKLPLIRNLNTDAPGFGNAFKRFPGRALTTGMTNVIASPAGSVLANGLVYHQWELPDGESLLGAALSGAGRTNTISPFNPDVVGAVLSPRTALAGAFDTAARTDLIRALSSTAPDHAAGQSSGGAPESANTGEAGGGQTVSGGGPTGMGSTNTAVSGQQPSGGSAAGSSGPGRTTAATPSGSTQAASTPSGGSGQPAGTGPSSAAAGAGGANPGGAGAANAGGANSGAAGSGSATNAGTVNASAANSGQSPATAAQRAQQGAQGQPGAQSGAGQQSASGQPAASGQQGASGQSPAAAAQRAQQGAQGQPGAQSGAGQQSAPGQSAASGQQSASGQAGAQGASGQQSAAGPTQAAGASGANPAGSGNAAGTAGASATGNAGHHAGGSANSGTASGAGSDAGGAASVSGAVNTATPGTAPGSAAGAVGTGKATPAGQTAAGSANSSAGTPTPAASGGAPSAAPSGSSSASLSGGSTSSAAPSPAASAPAASSETTGGSTSGSVAAAHASARTAVSDVLFAIAPDVLFLRDGQGAWLTGPDGRPVELSGEDLDIITDRLTTRAFEGVDTPRLRAEAAALLGARIAERSVDLPIEGALDALARLADATPDGRAAAVEVAGEVLEDNPRGLRFDRLSEAGAGLVEVAAKIPPLGPDHVLRVGRSSAVAADIVRRAEALAGISSTGANGPANPVGGGQATEASSNTGTAPAANSGQTAGPSESPGTRPEPGTTRGHGQVTARPIERSLFVADGRPPHLADLSPQEAEHG
ncbi:MAG: hypothetical protein IRZ05_20215, partial [Micromonosporaceae bacterium]|nr:hypothetical protein [Micromonosporaceae bacterium]